CLSKRDLLCGGIPTTCDNTYPCHTSWIHCCPFKCTPAAHGTAYYRVEPFDSQDIGEFGFGIERGPNGNKWETRTIRLLVFVQVRGPCRSVETTYHVGDDDEPHLRVERLTRADEIAPPHQ